MHSSSHNFLYLHVSKTGGNSIQKILLPFSDDKIVTKAHQDGVDRFGLLGPVTPFKHATLSDYEHQKPGLSQDCRVVISVRDPVQRALSAFFSPHRWMQKTINGGYDLIAPSWSEESFVSFLKGQTLPPAVDWLKVDGHVRPPDHVIRFDQLQPDLDRFLESVGVNPRTVPPLPHANKSADTANLKQELERDPAIRQFVLTHYQEDADLFGYA